MIRNPNDSPAARAAAYLIVLVSVVVLAVAANGILDRLLGAP